MKSILKKNIRVAAPRVLACLAFALIITFGFGMKDVMFVVFMMNLACIITAQDSKEMAAEASWPVDRRSIVDARFIVIILTIVLFDFVGALFIRDSLGPLCLGTLIAAISAGTVFPFAIAGKNFIGGLISGASSALIIILMGEVPSLSIPWTAWLLITMAVLISSRTFSMRLWMKGGPAR